MTAVTHAYDQFTYTNKLFEANTSSLNWASGAQPTAINIVGRTGAVVQYTYDRTVFSGVNVVSWEYVPAVLDPEKNSDIKGTRIRVFNE